MLNVPLFRREPFRPHDVVTFLDVTKNPLRMVVRAVRGDMVEIAPHGDGDTRDVVQVNARLLMKAQT
jgi:hypothetical protein